MTVSEQSVDSSTVSQKLPYEQQHLSALQRMQLLGDYYNWSLSLFGDAIGKRILDAGCGIGNGSEILASKAEHVVAADLSAENVSVMKKRFANVPNVEPIQADLDSDLSFLKQANLDTIVCRDVLEHIEDDVELLKRFRNIVEPGGRLLIKVPDGEALYGKVDEASGHFRRYTKRSLGQALATAGWDVERLHYMNFFAVGPYFLKSVILRRNANFSRTFPPWQLRLIRRLIPYLRVADRLIGPPIGLSAIAVAVRPDTD